MKIKIITKEVQMEAELNQTETASAILDILPLKAIVDTWGEEIFFEISIQTDLENIVSVAHVGDLAYWHDGKCFCIFFGMTPISDSEEEIIPATGVTVIGKLLGNPKEFKKVKVGDEIKVRKLESTEAV